MTYTILTKSSNSDGSFLTEVQYVINGTTINQIVVHSPGSQLSDILSGIVNMGNVLNQQLQNIANAPSVLDSITLNISTDF